ncbi:hypothetical protein A176_004877 [Myxococcus hansupus]|uniref:Uncharacterized protein n=1 Tax=Pseudomyxococcus hansupus TaxID=1297742 RepID=A0A0H4X2U1_9BACT|nr:hypothetical protein A176_004877 [Myxococcus hansupus]
MSNSADSSYSRQALVLPTCSQEPAAPPGQSRSSRQGCRHRSAAPDVRQTLQGEQSSEFSQSSPTEAGDPEHACTHTESGAHWYPASQRPEPGLHRSSHRIRSLGQEAKSGQSKVSRHGSPIRAPTTH